MQVFRELLEQEELRSAIDRAMELQYVQGVVLEINPIILRFWWIAQAIGFDQLHDLFDRYGKYWPFVYYDFYEQLSSEPVLLPSSPLTLSDIESISHTEHELSPPYLLEPFIMRICRFPLKIPTKYRDEESALVKESPKQFRVVFTTRPQAYLSGKPPRYPQTIKRGTGIKAEGQGEGTLGGIVHASDGRSFGQTCAHVIGSGNETDQVAIFKSSNDARIGEVKYQTILKPSDKTEACNSKVNTAQNSVDSALIELDQDVRFQSESHIERPVTRITDVFALVPGQHVTFLGARSGQMDVSIGGYGVYYRFQDHKGHSYCFKDLIELKTQLNNFLFGYVVFKQPVRPGDSGAWVLNHIEKGYGWCGTVIATDEENGFFISAENVVKWWEDECNLSLTLPGE